MLVFFPIIEFDETGFKDCSTANIFSILFSHPIPIVPTGGLCLKIDQILASVRFPSECYVFVHPDYLSPERFRQTL